MLQTNLNVKTRMAGLRQQMMLLQFEQVIAEHEAKNERDKAEFGEKNWIALTADFNTRGRMPGPFGPYDTRRPPGPTNGCTVAIGIGVELFRRAGKSPKRDLADYLGMHHVNMARALRLGTISRKYVTKLAAIAQMRPHDVHPDEPIEARIPDFPAELAFILGN